MTARPELLAHISAESIQSPGWSPGACSCGLLKLKPGVSERTIGPIVHGVVACYVWEREEAA